MAGWIKDLRDATAKPWTTGFDLCLVENFLFSIFSRRVIILVRVKSPNIKQRGLFLINLLIDPGKTKQ